VPGYARHGGWNPPFYGCHINLFQIHLGKLRQRLIYDTFLSQIAMSKRDKNCAVVGRIALRSSDENRHLFCFRLVRLIELYIIADNTRKLQSRNLNASSFPRSGSTMEFCPLRGVLFLLDSRMRGNDGMNQGKTRGDGREPAPGGIKQLNQASCGGVGTVAAARIAKACRCDQELRIFGFDPQS